MSLDSITLSRESILQRKLAHQPRLCRRPSVISQPLHIIVEEDETWSRTPSPMPTVASASSHGLKARRRHCNLSATDIQIARDFVGIGGDDGSLADGDNMLLLVPPTSAKIPWTPSPIPSPDSFRLTFTERSYEFPHPPIPTPTSLSSKHISSFCASPTDSSSSGSSPRSGGLPLTPNSSDEDFFQLPSPRFNPRRAAIQPLLIRKHLSSTLPVLATPIAEQFDITRENTLSVCSSFSLSPYTSSDSDSLYEAESETESDSEWFKQELSKVVTVTAPTAASLTAQAPRPDSMLLAPQPVPSKKTQPTPKKRISRRSYLPTYPPPPVPTIPTHLRSASVPRSPLSPMDSPLFGPFASPSPSPRPPPRNSVPADFSFDDEDNSEFSFALYQVEIDERVSSPCSAYSQPSYLPSSADSPAESDFGSPLEYAEFDLDSEYPMMLPLSLPGTPIDLEADFVNGLEELRMRDAIPTSTVSSPTPLPVLLEEPREEVEEQADTGSVYEAYERPRTPPSVEGHCDAWSFSTPSPAPSHTAVHHNEPVLKSKWSSSTLASVREEHERRTSSSKFMSYFAASPAKKSSSSPSSGHKKTPPPSAGHRKTPSTPLSPMSFIGSSSKKKRASAGRREYDYPPIAAVSGVRRRGSINTISDAGSDDTSSSSSSNGLRRKPIPLELFLRR